MMGKGEKNSIRKRKCFNKLTQFFLVKFHLHKSESDLGF